MRGRHRPSAGAGTVRHDIAAAALALALLVPLPLAAQPATGEQPAAPPPGTQAPAMAAEASLDGEVTIELNKLEPVDDTCRIYLLLDNQTDATFNALQVELVSFDTEGIISQRVAVDLAPLRAGKTMVKLFDVPATPCDRISRLLLNDALSCQVAETDLADCLGRLKPSSRAKIDFWK